jgi:hypothetical protein
MPNIILRLSSSSNRSKRASPPLSVHEFVNILRGLPISIDRAMYMEGGGPSQLFIGAGKDTLA